MRTTGAKVVGGLLLAAGVVVGALLWFAAGRRYDDAVTDLAPVPLGCTTTLSFDEAGEYTFFVETTGRIGEIDGDCVTDDRSYDVPADEAPRVSLTLLDSRGEEVDLDRADGPTYDRAGRRGAAVRTVDIDEAGDYELTATSTSDDAEVVVRVGRAPASGVAALRISGVLALLVGVSLGLLLLFGPRRRPVVATNPPSGPQWPAGAPQITPVAPPYSNRPVPPPYAPRPPSHGPYRPPDEPNPPGTPPAPARPPGGWPGRGGPLPPPAPPG